MTEQPGGYTQPKGGWERWLNGQVPDAGLDDGPEVWANMFRDPENQLTTHTEDGVSLTTGVFKPLGDTGRRGRDNSWGGAALEAPSHITVRIVSHLGWRTFAWHCTEINYACFPVCLCV